MNYSLIEPVNPRLDLDAVQRVLTNRGIKLEDIAHYLRPDASDLLPPESIDRIKDGAIMLIKHIHQNDMILIQVDSDCDGMTSAALLINYLNCLFPGFVQNNILYRTHEGKQHGIILNTIPKEVKLVIAPDSSSNDYYEHKALYEAGVDVLVIDHHEADKISEYACVINNQLCDYATKSLSGVGMVYKFCCYIDQLLGKNEAEKFIDLVALGMVADMMDLRDQETHYLVQEGLERVRNPFFKGMADKQDYTIEKHGGLNPHTIGFYIAPYVNATMRAGTQDEKMMLFESMLDFKGYEPVASTKRGAKGTTETRVEQACRNCTNIKNRQGKSVDTALEIIELLIKANNLLEDKILVVKLDPQYAIDKNITGLVANKLANQYQRPTLILNQVIHDDGSITWEGSGRGYNKSDFKDLKQFLNDSGLVEYAQGHGNALGVGIAEEKFDDLMTYINTTLKDFDFTPRIWVDLIWDASNFNTRDILDLAELENIWGQGIEKPLVAIENIKVHAGDCQLLKGSTLKITLPNGTTLIKFGSSEEEYEQLYSEMGCVTINVVGECKRNIWMGMVSPQIEVQEYEIVGTTEYYF